MSSWKISTGRLCFVFLVSIVLLFCSVELFGGTYQRPPFVYYYKGVDAEDVISRLDDNLRQRLPELERTLDVKLDHTTKIYLTLTREEFYRVTQGRAPSWAGGLAYPDQWKIAVKAPQFFGQGVPLEVLTTHEITHLLLHKASGYNYLPKWLDEGFCVLLSGEARTGSFARLGRAALGDRLMGLPRVDRVLGFSSQDADLAYSEAKSAADYFVERFDWQAVRDLLKYIRQDEDFENAFFRATGVGYEAWQIEWMDYARNRYKWVILLEVDTLIWIFIVLLAAVVVIIAYIKRRRQLREWMLEEEDEDDDWEKWDTPWDQPSESK